MPEIIPRYEWGARQPKSKPVFVPWSQRKKICIHYSAASENQTPRQIQDYHMDVRGWADIGYNYLVHSVTGAIYEGRGGAYLGAHAAGHNTESIGICVIGKDRKDRKDVSDKARASIVWLCNYLDIRAGRRLERVGHRDLGATACPGDELYQWLRAGMPLNTKPEPKPEPTAKVKTWEEVMKELPLIRQGTRGEYVRKCQSLLAANGHPPRNSFRPNGEPDGIAGAGTADAIRKFQAARKLTVDGICGPRTWRELMVKGAGR